MAFKLGLHESLTQLSTDWIFGQDQDPEVLEKEMISFMVENKGIGLAANQIGITKNVFVMGSTVIPNFPEPFAVFNPKIISISSEVEIGQEGCLSYPDLWLQVKRPEKILAEYQTSNGDTVTVEMSGLISRCFQHEYDHLKGICFVDRVSKLKLQLAMKRLRKNK
jgi:peptide deformylase